MKENNNRTQILQVRLTPGEQGIIQERFGRSTSQKLSDYVRKILLDKPVHYFMRNQSLDDFMTELIALRNELNAIGHNYNQLVKRLHTLEQLPEINHWLLQHEAARKILFNKVEQIKSKINSINDTWLQ